MHSFELYMPTRLVYGADSIEKLAAAAAPYGKRALITYGGAVWFVAACLTVSRRR